MKTPNMTSGALLVAAIPGFLALSGAGPAEANDEACRPLISKIQEADKARTKVRAYSENFQNGKLFLRSTQLIERMGDFMVESIDQKQWSRQYKGGFYSSTDGKTWSVVSPQDPDWRDKWNEQNKAISADAFDLKCDFSETIDGKEYSGLQYRIKKEKPHKLDYLATQIFDPETFELVRSTNLMGNFEIVTTYEKDETISLPSPE